MKPISRAWGTPLIMSGILLGAYFLLGLIFSFLITSIGNSTQSLSDRIPSILIDISLVIISVLMIRYGVKLRSRKNEVVESIEMQRKTRIYQARVNFYFGMGLVVIPFFLLHWNGLFSFTYFWYLKLIGGEHEFQLQILAAAVSTLVICVVTIFLFEYLLRNKYRG